MKSNAKIVILIYVLSSIFSFIYAIYYKKYNGDFSLIGLDDVTLSTQSLLCILCFNLLPYLFIWKHYLFCKNKKYTNKKNVKLLNISIIGNIAIFLCLTHILLAVYFGVGVMSSEQYSASGITKIIIQIIYRFSPLLWSSIYIIESEDRKKIILITILLIIYSLVQHSLGGIMGVITLFLIKKWNIIRQYLVKYKFILIFFIIIFPKLVTYGYNYRDSLRSGDSGIQIENNSYHIIFNNLCGRLSSFSNSAYIIQYSSFYDLYADNLSPLFYQKEMLSPLGIHFSGDYVIGTFFRSTLGDDREHVSIMVGPLGIFTLSAFKSTIILILNIITFIILVKLLFFLFSKTNISHKYELALLFTIRPTVSGNASEYFSIILGVFLLLVIMKIFNFISRIK